MRPGFRCSRNAGKQESGRPAGQRPKSSGPDLQTTPKRVAVPDLGLGLKRPTAPHSCSVHQQALRSRPKSLWYPERAISPAERCRWLTGTGNTLSVVPLGLAIAYTALATEETMRENEDEPDTGSQSNVGFADQSDDLTRAFVRLTNLPTYPLDRLSRYEATLWRQACQILFTPRRLSHR